MGCMADVARAEKVAINVDITSYSYSMQIIVSNLYLDVRD